MKKKLFIATSVASLAIVACTFVFSSGLNVVPLKAGTRTHTVSFTAQNSVIEKGEYDSGEYAYPVSLSQKNAIVVSDSEKYDMAALEGVTNTSFMCSGSGVTFGGDYLISFVSEGWESFTVSFALKKAQLDTDASFISFYYSDGDDESYDNASKFKIYESGETNKYYAAANFYPYYGYSIKINEVKLVFTCV